jgi:hypothetical protein
MILASTQSTSISWPKLGPDVIGQVQRSGWDYYLRWEPFARPLPGIAKNDFGTLDEAIAGAKLVDAADPVTVAVYADDPTHYKLWFVRTCDWSGTALDPYMDMGSHGERSFTSTNPAIKALVGAGLVIPVAPPRTASPFPSGS